MQTAAKNNLIFTGISSIQRFRNPQTGIGKVGSLKDTLLSHLAHIARSQTAFHELTETGIRLAEHAYNFRNISALEETSTFLMNLPISGAHEIGAFYYALALKRRGSLDQARALLETVADTAPITYRARAIQALGAICRDEQKDLSGGLQLQLEALRVASPQGLAGLQTCLMARLCAAAIQSDYGDHRGALSGLEALPPLVKAVARWNPLYFCIYHNSLAVELGETGQLEAACDAMEVALNSPFALVYPELSETRDELELKRARPTRSIVAVNPLPTSIQAEERRTNRPNSTPVASPRVSQSSCCARRFLALPLIAFAPIKMAAVGPILNSAARLDHPAHLPLDRLGESSQPRAPPTRR